MKFKKIQFNIYKLIIVSLMLDAYALFYIRTFPVTPFTIVSIIFVVLCIAETKENLMKIRKKAYWTLFWKAEFFPHILFPGML